MVIDLVKEKGYFSNIPKQGNIIFEVMVIHIGVVESIIPFGVGVNTIEGNTGNND